jgi:hypothetical protein
LNFKGGSSGGWRRLHNVELHNVYILPNIIRVIKSRSTGCAGHVAYLGKRKMLKNFGWNT